MTRLTDAQRAAILDKALTYVPEPYDAVLRAVREGHEAARAAWVVAGRKSCMQMAFDDQQRREREENRPMRKMIVHTLSACAECSLGGNDFIPDDEAFQVTGELYCEECAPAQIAQAKWIKENDQ